MSGLAKRPDISAKRIGIIGGSGLYHIDGLTDTKWVKVNTPFGPPSDELLTGRVRVTPLLETAAA